MRSQTEAPITLRKIPTLTIDELLELAGRLGVRVVTHGAGPKGWFDRDSSTISVHSALRGANLRCTLAHELAHAMAGDRMTGNPFFDRRMERAADVAAASMLIDCETYRELEALHDGRAGAIARELGVTVELLEFWKSYIATKQRVCAG